MKDAPFRMTMATPAGNRIAPAIWSQPCTFASVVAPADGTSRLQPEQEQQHPTDQVEMRMRRCQRKILLDAHCDSGKHPDQ